MVDSKILVALVGGGTIAPLHARYLQSSPTAELIAIIDPFPPGQRLAKQLGVARFTSVGALLESQNPRPDTYIVCVPSSLHVAVSREIIEQAAPQVILVEKPFSTDSRSGSQLLEFARQKKCTIMVGHHRRFHPCISAAKATIEAGKIGTITAISGLWTVKKNDGYFTEAPWRCSRSAGGGPIWTNFVHDVDVLHYLTGSKVSRIWATATSPRREKGAVETKDAVEEGAAIMLEFGNGVVGSFLVCDNVPSPYGWESATGDNPLFPPAEEPVDSYRIFGTEGTLSEPDGVLWTYKPEEAKARGLEIGWNIPMSRQQVPIGNEIPFQQQTEHLVRVIRGMEEPRCSGEDGLAAVKVCEAIINALKRRDGTPISVE